MKFRSKGTIIRDATYCTRLRLQGGRLYIHIKGVGFGKRSGLPDGLWQLVAQWSEADSASWGKSYVGHVCLVKRGEKKVLTLQRNQEKKTPDEKLE